MPSLISLQRISVLKLDRVLHGLFALAFDVGEEDKESLYEFTKEICEYRLQGYFERKEK